MTDCELTGRDKTLFFSVTFEYTINSTLLFIPRDGDVTNEKTFYERTYTAVTTFLHSCSYYMQQHARVTLTHDELMSECESRIHTTLMHERR